MTPVMLFVQLTPESAASQSHMFIRLSVRESDIQRWISRTPRIGQDYPSLAPLSELPSLMPPNSSGRSTT